MARISYKRHRFPPTVIQYAVWLYFRFTLSFRDVEEMLAHRGVDVSYETVRAWTLKFGPKIAANLRRRKQPPSPRWHLDEMVSTIAGEHVWIWRAVDDEGEVMDMIVQKRRDAGAALRFLQRLLKNQNVEPETIVTDGLRSYRAALDRLFGIASFANEQAIAARSEINVRSEVWPVDLSCWFGPSESKSSLRDEHGPFSYTTVCTFANRPFPRLRSRK